MPLSHPGPDDVTTAGLADEAGEVGAEILVHPRRLAQVSDCLFCRIIDKEIPSTGVVETASSYAFRDLNPQAPTHVLVIPKRHITNADTVTGEHGADLADLLLTAQAVARQEGLVREGIDPDDGGGYRLVMNVGEISGNTVPHLHVHVLGGRRLGWPPG
ncbi:MAG: histidine triad nucleotide-binding protein [Acidimicrobiales bacterium]